VFLSLYRENTPPKRSCNPLSKAKPVAGFRPRVPLSVSYCPTAGLLSEAAVEKTVALARAGDDGRLGDSRCLDRAGDPSSLPACRKVGEDGRRDLAARDGDGDGGRSCGARSGVTFKGAFVEPVDVAVEDGAAWAALTGVLVGVAGARIPAARIVSSRAPASSRCRNSAAMSGWLTRGVNSSAEREVSISISIREEDHPKQGRKQARPREREGKPGRDLATFLATEGRTQPRLALLRPDASGGGFRQMPGPDSFGPRGVHYGRTSDSTRTRQQSACCAAERRTILEEGARIPARSACT
jgi:hypothetical protein